MPARCVAWIVLPCSGLLFLHVGPQKHLSFLEENVWSSAEKHLKRANVREKRLSLTPGRQEGQSALQLGSLTSACSGLLEKGWRNRPGVSFPENLS